MIFLDLGVLTVLKVSMKVLLQWLNLSEIVIVVSAVLACNANASKTPLECVQNVSKCIFLKTGGNSISSSTIDIQGIF